MGLFHFFRRNLFSFSGSYLLISFYNQAQNEFSDELGHFRKDKMSQWVQPQQKSGLFSFLASSSEEERLPLARPSDDLRWCVVEYDVQSAVVMALLVFAGGFSAICGATLAIVLEVSEDGPEVYHNWKSLALTKAAQERRRLKQPGGGGDGDQ